MPTLDYFVMNTQHGDFEDYHHVVRATASIPRRALLPRREGPRLMARSTYDQGMPLSTKDAIRDIFK